MITKFIAFLLVGVVGTLAHYSILYSLVEFFGYNPVWASGWGALAGLLINYTLNYSLTFKSQQAHHQTLPKFALIASMGFGLNLALMAGLMPYLYYLFAQIITTGIVLIWNFFANTLWTFKMDTPSHLPKAALSTSFKRLIHIFGLLLTLLAIRLLTLGFYPLYDPSESRYAEMGRKMLETHNWITPLIDYGVPFWGKPPLTVWLTAANLGLTGINNFSARLPSFLLSVGILALIYHLVNIQRSAATALTTVIILISTVLFFVMSGTVAMDVCMNLGITLTLVSFWLALKDPTQKRWGYLFFVGLSIGLLAKGPIAVVLPGLSIFLWTLVTNEWLRIWKRIPWVTGTLLMLIISVPWYLIAEYKTPGFLNYFIIGEHWKRFTESGWTGDLYGNGHAKPRGTIWLYWLGGAFPWSIIFVGVVLNAFRKKQATTLLNSSDGWRLYCLLWMLSPLLFFSLSANIIWTYVLPGLAGFALLLGDWVTLSSRYKTLLSLCVPVVFTGIVLYYHYPKVEFFKSQQHLVERYQQEAQPDEALVYSNRRPYSVQFYLQGKGIELLDLNDLQARLTASNHDFYAIQMELIHDLPEPIKDRLEYIKDYNRFSLFHAHPVNKP